jgi:hypothetical protein
MPSTVENRPVEDANTVEEMRCGHYELLISKMYSRISGAAATRCTSRSISSSHRSHLFPDKKQKSMRFSLHMVVVLIVVAVIIIIIIIVVVVVVLPWSSCHAVVMAIRTIGRGFVAARIIACTVVVVARVSIGRRTTALLLRRGANLGQTRM